MAQERGEKVGVSRGPVLHARQRVAHLPLDHGGVDERQEARGEDRAEIVLLVSRRLVEVVGVLLAQADRRVGLDGRGGAGGGPGGGGGGGAGGGWGGAGGAGPGAGGGAPAPRPRNSGRRDARRA